MAKAPRLLVHGLPHDPVGAAPDLLDDLVLPQHVVIWGARAHGPGARDASGQGALRVEVSGAESARAGVGAPMSSLIWPAPPDGAAETQAAPPLHRRAGLRRPQLPGRRSCCAELHWDDNQPLGG